MQHTPGPWRQEDDYVVIMGNFRMTDLRYSGKTTGEAIANAKVIAAAPDLLVALQGVLRVADRKTDEFDAARAAIAKAVGAA